MAEYGFELPTRQNDWLSKRLLVLALALIFLVTGAIVFVIYKIERTSEIALLKVDEQKNIEVLKHQLDDNFSEVITSINFLAKSRLLRRYVENPSEELRRAIADEYRVFSAQKKIYDQIRFIGLDGRERIRINGAATNFEDVPADRLQDKSNRYYFKETIKLGAGAVYISPLDLNVERGKIELPIKPIIRFGMPVFDSTGAKRGIVLLNYQASGMLRAMSFFARRLSGDYNLVNADGYWLVGPDRDSEWGFMFPERRARTFANAYPAAWRRIGNGEANGQFDLDGGIFTVSEFSPAEKGVGESHGITTPSRIVTDEKWYLLSHVPSDRLALLNRPVLLSFVIIFAILALTEVVGGSFLIRHWTARRKAEILAMKNAENFRALFESAPDGLLVVDGEGKIALANDRMIKLVGYAREHLIGQRAEMLVPEAYRAVHYKDSAEFRRNPEIRNMGRGDGQLWVERADGGMLPVEIGLSPVEILGQRMVFCIVRDVSERYEREKKIGTLAKQLARDNADLDAVNKQLDAFSYTIAHDLRAPLRSITGFSQVLMEDYRESMDEEGQDYLSRVAASAQRMGRLIDDLLTLSKVSRAEFQVSEVSLSEIAALIAERLQKTDPDRKATVTIEPGLIAHGDQSLLLVVMENFLSNAWKYSSKKDETIIEIGARTIDGERVFFISDNGAGFDATYADKVFNPFERLHSEAEFEGTGIGLASVANIVNRHGGRVWGESEIEVGSTFYFTIPDPGEEIGLDAKSGPAVGEGEAEREEAAA